MVGLCVFCVWSYDVARWRCCVLFVDYCALCAAVGCRCSLRAVGRLLLVVCCCLLFVKRCCSLFLAVGLLVVGC